MTTSYQANQAVTNWNSVSYRLAGVGGQLVSDTGHWFSGCRTGGGKSAMDNFYAHYNSSTIGLEHNAHDQYLQTWMRADSSG